MKPQIMYALYGKTTRHSIPIGIFVSKWKAEEALRHLWSIRSPNIVRVYVTQPKKIAFSIIEHQYKFKNKNGKNKHNSTKR